MSSCPESGYNFGSNLKWFWPKSRINYLTNWSNIILVTNQIWLKSTKVVYSCNLYTGFHRNFKKRSQKQFLTSPLVKKMCSLPKTSYKRCLFRCLVIYWKFHLIAACIYRTLVQYEVFSAFVFTFKNLWKERLYFELYLEFQEVKVF